MTNETIEKIANVVNEVAFVQAHEENGDEHLCEIVAEAIYTEIVEQLENRISGLTFENEHLVGYVEQLEEQVHKAEVLERALKHLAHEFNGQQFYIYAQSDTDEETYEKFIQRAEKELKENETD